MNQAVASSFKVQPHTADSLLRDQRFHRLLSDDDWMQLPPAVRRRFSKRLVCGATATYVGDVVKVSFSRIGWWLAHAARLIGGPLPISRDVNVATVVTVSEEFEIGGQVWTRIYARRRGFPHVVHSSKRFSGPTGLEEYLGRGLVMTLKVMVEGGSLKFKSVAYCLQVGRRRIRIPGWLTPGHLIVTHTDLGLGRFLFCLELDHPYFGRLIEQSAVYREAAA